jgi:hypothetical protein
MNYVILLILSPKISITQKIMDTTTDTRIAKRLPNEIKEPNSVHQKIRHFFR